MQVKDAGVAELVDATDLKVRPTHAMMDLRRAGVAELVDATDLND